MSNDNAYMRQYMLDRYYARRKEAIELLGSRCVVCGSTEGLEIDHVDPKTKTLSLSKLWSVSRARYMRELELCQALCKKHHRQKTSREQSVPHGGGVSGKRNCKCDLCWPKRKKYLNERRRERKRLARAGS